jgi:hypothetical protein
LVAHADCTRLCAVSDDTRRPTADVLPGFEIHALDDGWTPLEAFVLIKSLDESGDNSWS